MTSQIDPSGIDPTYPKAGKDNNSQGFRDNFGYIQTALEVAAGELSDLQSKVVLKEPLEGDIAVDNDLLGNTLYNAIYAELHGKVYGPVNTNGTVNVSIVDGPYQVFTATGNTTLRFEDWPEEGWAKLTVEIKGDTLGEYILNFSTEGGGTIKKDTGFPVTFTLPIPGTIRIIEVWSRDGGTNVFLKYIGDW
jgi:hypothetical protein